jgi:hypothetical protein
MSKARKGVPKSEETRRRMSLSQADPNSEPNRRRREATSRRNAERACNGTHDFLVKGYHTSPKTPSSPTPYRSKTIELRLMRIFDADDSIKAWESPFVVQYRDAHNTARHALPDFLITLTTGKRKLVEGKSPYLLESYLNSEKFAAVRQWCLDNRVEFEILSTKNRCRDLIVTRVVE